GQPRALANSLLPSAEEAMEVQFVIGASTRFQVRPELSEVKIDPPKLSSNATAACSALAEVVNSACHPDISEFVISAQLTPASNDSHTGAAGGLAGQPATAMRRVPSVEHATRSHAVPP